MRVLLLVLLLLLAAEASALDCNATVSEQSALERWTQLSQLSFSRDSHAAAAFKNQLWVVGGVSPAYYSTRLEYTTSRADVLSSYNGKTWVEVLEEAPFRRRFGHALLTFTDASDSRQRLVLLGGFTPEPSNDVWVSSNGASWTQVAEASVPWSGRGYHCATLFNNQVFVMGGSPLNRQVWATRSIVNGASSTIGWKKLADAPWSARAALGCASHEVVTNSTIGDGSRESFLFVIGGWLDAGALNDVWRMDTSGVWVELSSAPWSPRGWFSLVSFDSRTPGDVQLGQRLWVFGGGVIGNGITKMHAYEDTWFTRDGETWSAASSSASGVSTAEWSQVSASTLGGTSSTRMVSVGKWGHAVVPFYRNVTQAYVCGSTCVTSDNATSLSGQVIAMCDPETETPPDPELATVLRQSAQSVETVTLYPDGCELCEADARYDSATTVPALVFIGGNIGSQKANEVYRSGDAMLCEKDGEVCSGVGVCTQGGACLCDSGKTGPFCNSDLDYTIISDTSCFPESATVITAGRGSVPIGSVRAGESVLALSGDGEFVFSPVYYLPHSTKRADTFLGHEGPSNPPLRVFIRVHHEWSDQGLVEPLELTPDHLIYYFDDKLLRGDVEGWLLHDLPQKRAARLNTNDSIFVAHPVHSSLSRSVVTRLELVRRHERVLTLYTTTGSLVVSGAVCSNFGDYYPLLPGRWAHRRDAVAFALFAPHRALFSLLPVEETAKVLRSVMDALVLPVLGCLRHCSTIGFT